MPSAVWLFQNSVLLLKQAHPLYLLGCGHPLLLQPHPTTSSAAPGEGKTSTVHSSKLPRHFLPLLSIHVLTFHSSP